MEGNHEARAHHLLDAALTQYLNILSTTNGWENLGTEEGVVGFRLPNDGDGPQTGKTVGTFNHSVQKIFDYLWDFNNKPNWDENLKEIRQVSAYGDVRIMYEQVKAPWPVSNRDYVIAQRFFQRDDGIIILNRSIDGVLPDTSGVVRGEIVFSGTYLKRVNDNTTEVTSLGCVDPKGSIPKALVNKALKKNISKLITIRKSIR